MASWWYQVMLVSLWNYFFMPISMAIDANCDFYQELQLGQDYYIYNKEYPENYGKLTSCRWVAKSPPGTKIVVSCDDVDMPGVGAAVCTGDRLSISLTGNINFDDAQNYCGKGSFSVVTKDNKLAVGLFSTDNTPGGRYVCSLVAIQDDQPTTTQSPDTCNCGVRHYTRIIGGRETGVNEFPYMAGVVSLKSSNPDLFCGATIISNRYVVTAAHCVKDYAPSQLSVLVGDHNISSASDTPYAHLYPVSAYEIYPDFNPSTFENDIAILQTAEPIKFNFAVSPACLPFKYTQSSFAGQQVIALGWGVLEFSGKKSDTLQEVDLNVIPNNECAPLIPQNTPVTPHKMCTYARGKDTCQNDSGGPLLWVSPENRRVYMLGVISYGTGCAINKPGVSTRLTSYLSWIVQRTGESYCIK